MSVDDSESAAEGVRQCHPRTYDARLDAIAGMLGYTSATTIGVYARIVDKIAEHSARYLEKLMWLS